MAIGFIISYILLAVVIGGILLPVVAIVSLVFSIMVALAENQNRPYRYPFAIRLVK